MQFQQEQRTKTADMLVEIGPRPKKVPPGISAFPLQGRRSVLAPKFRALGLSFPSNKRLLPALVGN
jgi:hypothetical protein